MRTVPFALASFLFVGACGGPQTSQANNGQANISNDARTSSAANGSAVAPTNGMLMLAIPSVSGPQAAAIMHERHEGMESMGDDIEDAPSRPRFGRSPTWQRFAPPPPTSQRSRRRLRAGSPLAPVPKRARQARNRTSGRTRRILRRNSPPFKKSRRSFTPRLLPVVRTSSRRMPTISPAAVRRVTTSTAWR